MQVRAATLSALLLMLAPQPLAAQLITGGVMKDLKKADAAAIGEAVQATLERSAVGASRKWTSPTGRSGHVRLLRGGAAAGATTGRARISEMYRGAERVLYTFNYRRAADGRWQNIG